ncbi:MAG: hypothetical protein Q9198_001531, partial [Flavoplaca austrocitrina]
MASIIPHKDAWMRARDRYVEDLSREEKALYEAASPESIFYDASAAEKARTSSSTSLKIADKLQPTIVAIEQYAKSTWKTFEQEFGKVIDGFRVHVKNVDKEVNMSHMIEASDSRALIRAQQSALERAKKEDAHRRMIAAIPSVDNYAQHKKLQKLRKQGTGTWILHQDVYQEWYNANRSSRICCF